MDRCLPHAELDGCDAPRVQALVHTPPPPVSVLGTNAILTRLAHTNSALTGRLNRRTESLIINPLTRSSRCCTVQHLLATPFFL